MGIVILFSCQLESFFCSFNPNYILKYNKYLIEGCKKKETISRKTFFWTCNTNPFKKSITRALTFSRIYWKLCKFSEIIKYCEFTFQKSLPKNVKPQIGYTGKKLESLSQINNETKFEHKHIVTNYGKCPAENCTDDYIGQIAR